MHTQTAMATAMHAGVAVAAMLPSFDLARVMARVAKENADWDAERLAAAEQAYRRFWYMAKVDPTPGALEPLADADKVWHTHILFTRQYAEDCQNYLGRFLHHNPFDEVNLALAPTYTDDLHRRLFGEPYVTASQRECTNCCDCSNC